MWETIKGYAQSAYDWVAQIWPPIGDFFSGLWSGIASSFQAALGWVLDKLNWIGDKASWIMGEAGQLADDVQEVGQNTQANGLNSDLGSNVISPQERVSRQITEQRSSHELNINAPPGVASLGKSKGNGLRLNLQPTGAY